MKYEPIAVIGISCRTAGTETLEELRRAFVRKEDFISEISLKRKNLLNLDSESNCVKMAELKEIDCFDHAFFNISKKESDFMSPEQRIVLELATEAVLNAGYSLESFRGRNCGVLVTSSESTYNKDAYMDNSLSVLGTLQLMISGRIAYFLDARGENGVYNSGCSSSLNIIHNACLRLSIGEWDSALVGGVSLAKDIEDDEKYKYKILGLLSKSYKSRAFDKDADGTSIGEGSSFFLLKRLKDAQRDGDFIYGIIKSGAIIGDGARCSKVTMPSPEAQSNTIYSAWQDTEIDKLTEIEAHGIGNKIGDSVEASAIIDNINKYRLSNKKIFLSSTKGTTGHLYETAGMISLSKVLTGFYFDEAYPMSGFEELNPLVDFESVGIEIPKETITFDKEDKRCVAIDAFGLGGSNSHIVVENYPKEICEEDVNIPCIMKISGLTKYSFEKNAEHFREALINGKTLYNSAVYTMNVGRDDYPIRKLIYAKNKNDLVQKLGVIYPSSDNKVKKVVFILKHENRNCLSDIYDSGVFPGLEKPEIKSGQDVCDLIEKAEMYRYITSCGITPDFILADSGGKASIQYSSKKISRSEIDKEDRKDSDDNVEKIINQLQKLLSSGDIMAVYFGNKNLIKKVDLDENIHIINAFCKEDLIELFNEWYKQGKSIDWDSFYGSKGGSGLFKKTPLPGYAFEKIPHWVESRTTKKKVQNSLKEELLEAKIEKNIDTGLVEHRDSKQRYEQAVEESTPVQEYTQNKRHLISIGNANIEKKNLSETISNEDSKSIKGSLKDAEEFLERLWMKILNYSDHIDYDEDFFYLGGNSLLVEMMSNPINDYFNKEFDIYEIYDNETIHKLAKCILQAG